MAHILLVEDDAINALIISKFLEERFSFDHAKNGEEALDKLETVVYDMVLMDINLGDEALDGVEVLKRMRKTSQNADVPTIAVTAYALPDDKKRFIDAGFDGYLAKPVIKPDLFALMSELMN